MSGGHYNTITYGNQATASATAPHTWFGSGTAGFAVSVFKQFPTLLRIAYNADLQQNRTGLQDDHVGFSNFIPHLSGFYPGVKLF